jgi:hypothetical protein
MSTSDIRQLKTIIGKVWGKQYGRIQSMEAAALKKVQKEYDQSVFSVSAEKITNKISAQRESIVLQEFGSKGLRFPWDPQILVFAKDVGIDPAFTSEVILFLVRDILLLDFTDDPLITADRLRLVERMGSQLKNDPLSLARIYAERCFPATELIILFKDLLELWQDDIHDVLRIVFFEPDLADQLLRKEFVNRAPYIDSNGVEHKQPDQPVVGRVDENKEIKYYIGENQALYTARMIQLFMYSAYYAIYKQDWLSQEAITWIEQKFDIKRWLIKENVEKIEIEIKLAKSIWILKTYWDSLITQIRKSFFQKKDFKGLGDTTKRLILELSNIPETNIIFSVDLLKQKIIQNLQAGIFLFFESTFKMKQNEISEIYEGSKENFIKEFEQLWSDLDYETLYRNTWTFWNELRIVSSQKKRIELVVEFEFAQEQRRVIESFDTIQKKHFTKISYIMNNNPPGTGIDILDRTIALITLELSEISLSGIDISVLQKKKFEEIIITQLTNQIKFLLDMKIRFDLNDEQPTQSGSKPSFDAELENAVGVVISNYINDWYTIITDIFKTRDRFLREKLTTTEKYQLILEIYERYIKSGIGLLQYFDKQEQLNVLDKIQRLNILDFAKYVVLASNTKITIKEAYDKAAKYFGKDPVKLDGQAKFFDVLIFIKLISDNLTEDSVKTETKVELKSLIQLVDSNMDISQRLLIKDCEKIIRTFLEKQNVRNIQFFIQEFRDKVYEWNVNRYVEKEQFINWLSRLDTNRINTDDVTEIKKDKDNDRSIAIVYQDQTGERKGIGKESYRALDAGLFQAMRPSELIRNFGIELRNMEFTITDPKFPVNWVWLNQLPVVGKESGKYKVLESNLFINLKKEPNIRNLDAVHNIIHRIIEGKERREVFSDDLLDDTIREMINDVLVEEKTEAIRFFEAQPRFGTPFNFAETSYTPYLLLNFTLKIESRKILWDTIEVFGGSDKVTREEFSTGGYPWILSTSNFFHTILEDLFNKRLEGSVVLSKATFIWPFNNIIYFAIADVKTDTNTARIVIFKSIDELILLEKPDLLNYNFVDIRRRLDLILSTTPEKLRLKCIIEAINASDTQLVIDKLEHL